MPNKTCLRRPSFISKEQVKSNPRKLSGNLWLQVATDAWTSSTRPWRCTKRSTLSTLITLTVLKDLFRSVKTSAWSTNSSVRNWWPWIGRKRLRDSMNMLKTLKHTRDSRPTTSSSSERHQPLKYRRCQTWATFLGPRTSAGCRLQPSAKRRKTEAGEALLQICSIELDPL